MYSQSKFGSFALGSTPERISLQLHRLSARASQRWYIDDSESRVCFDAAVDMPCLRQEYCVRKDIISSSDAEWFSYGLVQRCEKLITLCFLFPLGWLLSSFSASFAFYLSFFLLRVRTNGYHAKTFAGCLLFSVCSECVLFLLILPNLRAIALLWVLASSTITIFLFAPYDHPNLHMTKEELAASKHMAMLTVLILDMALILSLSMQFYAFANGLALGLGFTAFLLIMEYGKQIYEKEICKQWKTKK